MNMSIESMTNVSYMLYGASGIFLAAAAVLFFTLDITKCWRMVSGMRFRHGNRQPKTDRTTTAAEPETKKTGESTVLLEAEETILLDSGRETVLLECGYGPCHK